MGTPNKSKIPLRGIGKLFTHLDAGVRAKLESAFTEAENLINYHNESTTGKQEKRVISGYVSAPVIELTKNNRGFDVTWERLNDQFISFYEAQVSLTSNFADPSVYKIAETSLSVEGMTETVYVRVRGVRWSGDTGNWSNTVTSIFDINGPVTYSKGLDDVYAFYVTNPGSAYPGPIQHLTITPQRQNGGMLVFGSFSGGGGSAADPSITVLLNNVPYIEIARADFSPSEDGPFPADGPRSGLGCGLGPVFVRHDQFYFGINTTNTATTRTSSGSHVGSGVKTDWTAADPTVYTVTYTPSPSSLKTNITTNLNFTGFNFGIPSENIIQGIKVTYVVPAIGYGSSGAQLHEMRLFDAGVARANKITSATYWANGTVNYTPVTKSIGGFGDFWGEESTYWTPAKINASNFGVLLVGKLFTYPSPYPTISSSIATQWASITVYHAMESSGEVKVQIRYNSTPGAGTLLACTLNVVEFGESLT